jgi:hypothetical protein
MALLNISFPSPSLQGWPFSLVLSIRQPEQKPLVPGPWLVAAAQPNVARESRRPNKIAHAQDVTGSPRRECAVMGS